MASFLCARTKLGVSDATVHVEVKKMLAQNVIARADVTDLKSKSGYARAQTS